MSIKDNKRFAQLKVAPGEYVPDMGMDYPEDDPYARLVPVHKVRDVKFDESYPFHESGFKFGIQRFAAYVIIWIPVYLINKFRYGMKVKGRGVLIRNFRSFRKGIVSVSNHCYRYDGAAVAHALMHRLWIPMLADHFEGESWWFLKYFGGIPLPDGSLSATKKFNESFDLHHAAKGWVHVFPEARSWLFYKPLRPWRKGAFSMAYKWNAPVLPVALSFRPRTGIYKLFEKPEVPLVTVNIGDPIFPDQSVPRKVEVDRLMHEAFTQVCRLGGIEVNSWPVVWNENQSSNI